MLRITLQILIAFDVNVTYAQSTYTPLAASVNMHIRYDGVSQFENTLKDTTARIRTYNGVSTDMLS